MLVVVSSRRSDADNFASVTAELRICRVPTLLSGSWVAAYDVPPRATNRARRATWWRRRYPTIQLILHEDHAAIKRRHTENPASLVAVQGVDQSFVDGIGAGHVVRP
jgi:hypothetical protein